ncbi:MAG: spore coat polysaccharide biosynthesis protein SpsL [Nitrospirales bacterium]|nr:MAG: spore coat polysaccharide biosynthesis protein SpsL [Nitrospirales bacterium]
MIEGAVKGFQKATSQGVILQDLIHGVEVKETRNLITSNGITTELFRSDWNLISDVVDHIIHVSFRPNAVSAWHMHENRTDYISVIDGSIRIVVYDGRPNSPTAEKVSIIHSSNMHPTVVTLPPGVWHGFENLDQKVTSIINYANKAYDYKNPDEWRLPWDTEKIPYRFR